MNRIRLAYRVAAAVVAWIVLFTALPGQVAAATPAQSSETETWQWADCKAPLNPAIFADEKFGVNESFRATDIAKNIGAKWSRFVFEWSQIEEEEGNYQKLTHQFYLGPGTLDRELANGFKVYGLLKNTPPFAQLNPADGVRSKPDLAKWGHFVRLIVSHYKGKIDHWAIWNEVEISPGGPNARYNTLVGTAADYLEILKIAYKAAKFANPDAKVIVAPYSYHFDLQEGGEQSLPWFDAFIAALLADPEAEANNYYFDVFAMNIYRNPHDLYDRIAGSIPWSVRPPDRTSLRSRLESAGIDPGRFEWWITETNFMAYDDAQAEGWDAESRNDGFRITMQEQAAALIQAYALAFAAGWDKVFWHAMSDDPPPPADELWGLARFHNDRVNADTGRLRPAACAYRMSARYMAHASNIRLHTLDRPNQTTDPDGTYNPNPRQYAPRFEWHVQQVTFDRGNERTFVLWNSGPEDVKVAVQRSAETARLLDMYGNELPLQQSGQNWLIDLGKATRHFSLFGGDPADYFFVGGSPVFLIEYSPTDANSIAPRLATDTDIAAEVAAPTPEISLPGQGEDYGIANGHFYPQARGDRPISFGYTILDDTLCPCFTQFNALGGVAALGYPASQPYREGPFVYQATQGSLLQWNPATGQMNFANVFDILSANGFDDYLEVKKQIPPSFDWSSDDGRPFEGSGGIVENHFNVVFNAQSDDSEAMSAARQALRTTYVTNPHWLLHYGLPMGIKEFGNVVVVRGQRAAFQYWKEDVPWASEGSVTKVLGGDVYKESGLIPDSAVVPITAPDSP